MRPSNPGATTSRVRLAAEFADFSGGSTERQATLAELIAAGGQILSAAAKDAEERAALDKDYRTIERKRSQANDRLATAETSLNAWKSQWAEAIAGALIAASGAPGEANIILDLLATLAQQFHDVHELRGRIGEIDDYAARFTADVSALTAEIAPDSAHLPADRAAAALNERLAQAIADEQKRTHARRAIGDSRKNGSTSR